MADVLVRNHAQRGTRRSSSRVDEHRRRCGAVPSTGLNAGVCGPDRRALARASRADEASPTSHPTLRRRPQALRPRLPAADGTTRRYLQDVYAGFYSSVRGVKTGGSDADALFVHGTKPSGSKRPTTLSTLAYKTSAPLYDERPDFVLPGFRFNEAARSSRGCRTSAYRARPAVGIPLRGREPGSRTCGRRDDQLPERAHIRAPGEDLRDTFWPVAHTCSRKDILRFHLRCTAGHWLLSRARRPKQLLCTATCCSTTRDLSRCIIIDPLE